MKRIDPAKPLGDCNRVVGTIWRSRHQELEREVFDRFPRWMHQPEQQDYDMTVGLPVAITPLIDDLGPRERKVLYLRYWFDMTQKEIAVVFELSQARIHQIEARALRKMRHPSRSDLLKDFC